MSRIHWLDAARALAIVSVVVCHSAEGVYGLTLESMTSMGLASELSGFAFFTFGRIGVPLCAVVSKVPYVGKAMFYLK